MHRKFITLIVTAAIIVTAFSSAPARAGNTERFLGGLAAIAILGAAIHHHEKKKERRARATVPQYHQPKAHSVRPLPDRVAKYDLPRKCLKPMNGYPSNSPLLGPRCLERHYRHAAGLPQHCRISFWNGHKMRDAYEPRCLRRKGYRVVNTH